MNEKYRQKIELLIFGIIILLAFYFGRHWHINTEFIQGFLRKFPLIYSAPLYIALYVIITFFIFFSKDVFWIIGAALFGVVGSAVFICIAETINAVILFFLARNLGRSYVEKSLSPKHKNLDEKLGGVSFFWLLIFRAAPLVPYRFMDLAAGFTSIRLRKYLTAVILGSPVKMFWIQYIIAGVGKNVLSNPQVLVEYFLKNKFLMLFGLVYVIMIIMVVFKIRNKK